jgi:hypothetical protein
LASPEYLLKGLHQPVQGEGISHIADHHSLIGRHKHHPYVLARRESVFEESESEDEEMIYDNVRAVSDSGRLTIASQPRLPKTSKTPKASKPPKTSKPTKKEHQARYGRTPVFVQHSEAVELNSWPSNSNGADIQGELEETWMQQSGGFSVPDPDPDAVSTSSQVSKALLGTTPRQGRRAGDGGLSSAPTALEDLSAESVMLADDFYSFRNGGDGLLAADDRWDERGGMEDEDYMDVRLMPDDAVQFYDAARPETGSDATSLSSVVGAGGADDVQTAGPRQQQK